MDFLRLNIKHLRTLSGLTQPQLGEILGVSRDNVASYERGTSPPVEIIHKLVNHFHVKFNDLLEKDLSKFESKNVEGVIIDMERQISRAYKAGEGNPVANEDSENYQAKNLESLERIIAAQELTIRTQQETIEALKQVIDSGKTRRREQSTQN